MGAPKKKGSHLRVIFSHREIENEGGKGLRLVAAVRSRINQVIQDEAWDVLVIDVQTFNALNLFNV